MARPSLGLVLSVYETAQPVLEKYINLSRLNDIHYLSNAERLMRYGLPGPIDTGHVVIGLSFVRNARRRSRAQFERAGSAAFRTAYTGNLTSRGNGSHDVAPFLATFFT
jgi:hypothetical protein